MVPIGTPFSLFLKTRVAYAAGSAVHTSEKPVLGPENSGIRAIGTCCRSTQKECMPRDHEILQIES